MLELYWNWLCVVSLDTASHQLLNDGCMPSLARYIFRLLKKAGQDRPSNVEFLSGHMYPVGSISCTLGHLAAKISYGVA